MKIAFLFVLFFTLFQAEARFFEDNPLVCNQTGSVPEAEFKALMNAMESKSFENQRVAVLANYALNAIYGFDGNQTAELMKLFTFDNTAVEVIELINRNILGITCEEVIGILEAYTFR